MSSSDIPRIIGRLEPVTVVYGHYGVGKTSLCLNLARDAAACGYRSVLVDLDVVNPYFRAAEYRGTLEAAGVEVVAPAYSEAGTNLDIPALTIALEPLIEQAAAAPDAMRLIIDAGGDDVGATALGRFAPAIAAVPHTVLYVVNAFRSATTDAAEAAGILREIEAASRLAATAVVSNAHLKQATDFDTVARGRAVAAEVADAAALPLMFVTAPNQLVRREKAALEQLCAPALLYPMESAVRTPWEVSDAL